MNRRGFLSGAAALPVVAVTTDANLKESPLMVGDPVDDYTPLRLVDENGQPATEGVYLQGNFFVRIERCLIR